MRFATEASGGATSHQVQPMFDTQHMLSTAQRLPDTRIDPGLSGEEIAAAQRAFGFEFPEDLRALLMAGLPTGPRWPDWRKAATEPTSPDADNVRVRLGWPLDGMLFDVEHNEFWDPDWGPRPDNAASVRGIVETAVRAAPVLIPIYAHRFMPSEPSTAGNPVLSVYQTDIIVYGRDLATYFDAELNRLNASHQAPARDVRCWTRWMNADWH